MIGVVYHVRPHSNERFCKIGMTNGRQAQERVLELNAVRYAGFSDWTVISEVWVEDAYEVEQLIHKSFDQFKVPFSSESEVFVVPKDEVENTLTPFKTVPTEKYSALLDSYNALQRKLETRLETHEVHRNLQSARREIKLLKSENHRLKGYADSLERKLRS